MLQEWVLIEPAHDNWPDVEWGRALNEQDADWLLGIHQLLHPRTVFELRVKTY